jgi:hypothetical protein
MRRFMYLPPKPSLKQPYFTASGSLPRLQPILAGNPTLVNATGTFDHCPLHKAARNGQAEVCRFLLTEAGADVDQTDCDRWTALYMASYFGHKSCVQVCWVQPPPPCAGSGCCGFGIKQGLTYCKQGLTYCVSMVHVVLWRLQTLLELGADKDLADRQGRRPLDVMCVRGNDSSRSEIRTLLLVGL